MDARAAPGAGPPAGPIALATTQGRSLVVACILATGLTGFDATATSIALPAIGRDLHAGFGALQWTVTGYTLTLASFILLGGAAGDRFGRRRVLEIGIAWFALASLLCATAPSSGILIGARVLQGAGAALMTPASLAIIQASLRAEDRSRAIGTWAAWSGVATAAAPFLGGWAIQVASWRWVYLINPPLALLVMALSRRHVPETRAPGAGERLDLRGAALAVLGLAGVTEALIAAPDGIRSSQVLVPGVIGVTALAAFVAAESARENPMLPLGLLRSRQLVSANLVTFVVYGALGGFFFLVVVELQTVSGFSPVQAGAATLPVTVLVLLFSPASGALAQRIGPRVQMCAGPLVCAGGLALTLRLDDRASYLGDVLPAMSVFGAGLAIMVAPLTATALAAAPSAHAGVASGLNNAVARAAGLLAVAALPGLGGLRGDSYTDPGAFLAGFRVATAACIVALIIGGAIAGVTIRRVPQAVRA